MFFRMVVPIPAVLVLGWTVSSAWAAADAAPESQPWRVVEPASTSPYANDAERRGDMGCTRAITLGLFENVVSFNDGQGFDADLVQPLANASGCVLRIVVLPRSKIWAGLRSGEVQIATMSASTPERRRIAYFIPYGRWRNVIVARGGLGLETTEAIEAWMDAPGFRLGITEGLHYGPLLDGKVRQLRLAGKVREYPIAVDSLAGLRAGEVTAMIEPIVHAYLGLDPATREAFTPYPALQLPSFPVGLAFSHVRFTPANMANWQRVMEGLILSGVWRRIVQPYMPPQALADFLDLPPDR
ncbi:transporter substrate-binding domain-containing protein [Xanthobacter sp. DSM 24535]|uniref:substrate-binding periplasmic protein n=1 Tax=Roseixanthobacter psychrophilus TaxID=3119917 RepID=UPI00372C82E5